MNVRSLTTALTLLLLGGCLTSASERAEQRDELISEAKHELAVRAPCCEGFENANITDRWPAQLTLFKLDRNREVGKFGDDKSYFVGLEIPETLPSRNLLIRQDFVMKVRDPHAPATIFDKAPGMGGSYIMEPHIAFLDPEHKLLAEVTAPVCIDDGMKSSGIFASARVPEKTRYAIVFTRPQIPGAGVNHKYSGGGGTIGFGYEYSGTRHEFFGPTGILHLGLMDESETASLMNARDEECTAVLAVWGYHR